MDIVFVATELAPLVKVGGLADVVSGLTKTLRGLGHRVSILAPKFPQFDELSLARRLTPVSFTHAGKHFDVVVHDGKLASQVEVTLLDVPALFARDGVYGENGKDYEDNALRFSVFARAVAAVLAARESAGAPCDVVHLNDWPTALVPWFLSEAKLKIPTVLTIHNLAHQGVFPHARLAELGLDERAFTVDTGEFYGKLNVLKLGIMSATRITTVSPQYAKEILTPAHGAGLEGVLVQRQNKLSGILNGVDYAVWNPATDSNLVTRYDAEDPSRKVTCRGSVQHELGLSVDPDVPIVMNLGRIVHQKGADLMAQALGKILRASDAQIIVAGDGDPELVAGLQAAVTKFPGRAAFVRAASEPMVHKIFGAADIALVPSRFEPCGLVQLYAQRYGVVPVCHRTGGIVDTVVDADGKLETGTGFLFQEPTVEALVGAAERALASFASSRWPVLVRRVMRLDRSWDRPARQYERVYKACSED